MAVLTKVLDGKVPHLSSLAEPDVPELGGHQRHIPGALQQA